MSDAAGNSSLSMEASNSSGKRSKCEKRSETSTTEEKTLVDRISTLHDSILIRILSLLSARTAIRTCILSKRWQFLWTFLLNLDFEDDHILNNTWNSFDAVSFISNTLLLHRSPKLTSLCLHVICRKKIARTIDVWLLFATRKNVEALEIDCFTMVDRLMDGDEDEGDGEGPVYYIVPWNVLNNSCLVGLKLVSCDLRYAKLINWTSLKFLSLTRMRMSNDMMGQMLCGSPLVEFLQLCECWGFDFLDIKSERMRELELKLYGDSFDPHPPGDVELKIVAPNIKSLEISGWLAIRKLFLINSSSLVDIQLDFSLQDQGVVNHLEYANNVLELLQNLQSVKNLIVGQWCLKVLALLEMEPLPSLPSKLECLTVCTSLSREEQSGFVRVLSLFGRGCAPLTLVISIELSEYTTSEELAKDDEIENCLSALQKKFAAPLERIKSVEVITDPVQENAIQLVSFLLKNAKRLEKLIVVTCPTKEFDQEKSEAYQRILSIPKCSENTVVLFN